MFTSEEASAVIAWILLNVDLDSIDGLNWYGESNLALYLLRLEGVANTDSDTNH